jgi:hypothetical protein
VEAREHAREEFTAQEPLELFFDESRQAVAIAHPRSLRSKGLEVIADNLVQHALIGRAGLVLRGGSDHVAEAGDPISTSR